MKNTPTVFTLSLNSSLDHTYYLKKIVFEDINRVQESRIDAGGKGINVGRMLRRLKTKTEVICFLGGATGEKIVSLLKKEQVQFTPIHTDGETRNIFNFVEKNTGRTLRINEKGPHISPREEKELFACLEELPITPRDIFVISGSLPPGLASDTYQRIIEKIKRKTTRIFLDTDGAPLKEGIKATPCMIKPNLWELERLAGEKIENLSKLQNVIQAILDKGISIIALTLGEKGALLFGENLLLYGKPPRVTPQSSIGCGDAFLSGFLSRHLLGKEYPDCLRYAIACGAAKAGKKGTLMPEKEEVEALLDKVEISSTLPPVLGKGK